MFAHSGCLKIKDRHFSSVLKSNNQGAGTLLSACFIAIVFA